MIGSCAYIRAGHTTQNTDRRRFIPISAIAEKVGADLCQNFPSAHALAGCDSTSSLFRVGKRTAYSKLTQLVKKNPDVLKEFGVCGTAEHDVLILSVYGQPRSHVKHWIS